LLCVSAGVAEAKNGTVESSPVREKRRSSKQADQLPLPSVLSAQAKVRLQEAAEFPVPARKATSAGSKPSSQPSAGKGTLSLKERLSPKKLALQKKP